MNSSSSPSPARKPTVPLLLRAPREAAVAVDSDGTLAPIPGDPAGRPVEHGVQRRDFATVRLNSPLILHRRCREDPAAGLGPVLELRPAAFLAERPTWSVLYEGDDLAELPIVRLLSDRRARGGLAVGRALVSRWR